MTRGLFAGGAVLCGFAGGVATCHGMALRFNIQRTPEALAEEARGGRWLLVATVFFLLGTISAVAARAPRWAAIIVSSPVVLGIIPMFLVPFNLLPYLTAVIAFVLCFVALIVIVSSVSKGPRGADGTA